MHEPTSPRRARASRAAAPQRAAWAPTVVIIAVSALVGVAPAQAAASSDAVTPEILAGLVPETWQGLDVSYARHAFDSSGAAVASASYDDPADERSSSDLSLGITDLGPYRDATLLVRQADVAAGRLERTEIGGHPAFIGGDESRPSLEVIADRMWIRSRAFGPVFDAAALERAVSALPLDRIAALSDRPTAAQASYPPTGFTRGALRSFLPERVLGLDRPEDSFYAELHPTGVAWSGFPYEGRHDGRDARIGVTIWDLGAIADAARQRLADDPDGWQPFSLAGHQGFVESDVPAPRVLLFVDRFRVQVEAFAPSTPDPEWLRGALEDVDFDRLAQLGALIPAPRPVLDPLLGQPRLVAPERLAGALPEELAGMERGEIRAERSSNVAEVFDTAFAQARYAAAGGGPALTVRIFDQGIVTQDVEERRAAMRAVDIGSRTAYVSEPEQWPRALMIAGDRIVVAIQAEDETTVGPDELIAALEGLDPAQLTELAQP